MSLCCDALYIIFLFNKEEGLYFNNTGLGVVVNKVTLILISLLSTQSQIAKSVVRQ